VGLRKGKARLLRFSNRSPGKHKKKGKERRTGNGRRRGKYFQVEKTNVTRVSGLVGRCDQEEQATHRSKPNEHKGESYGN